MKKYLAIFLMMFALINAMTAAKPCLAASAKVDITADHTEVSVGDKVNVYIKISSKTAFGDFEANLTYDKSILKYAGGASVITGGNGYLKISELNKSETDTARKYALEFEAIKTGECKLAFDDQVMVYDESGLEMPVSSNSFTIKVKAQKTASANARLKTLETDPEGMSPVFDKTVREYNMHVNNEIERLIITAIPENNKAKVTVSGNDSLKEGENKIVITVLAESGDDIEYTINVFREAAPTVTAIPTITPAAAENAAEVIESNGETYILVNGRYQILEPDSADETLKGYIKTELTISGAVIDAYVPEQEQDSDFVLIYAKNSSGEEGFYQYDKAENTMQRYAGASKVDDNSAKYRAQLNNAAVIIAVLSGFSMLITIAAVWLLIKSKQRKKDDLD